MPSVIAKTAQDASRFRRISEPYPAARAAFGVFLDRVCSAETTVLLPSYIGWSPREGSGVFDPVRERSLRHAFYRMDRSLNIDEEHARELLVNTRRAVLVLVHYFGRVDPASAALAAVARSLGATVIEDSAHALYTDLVLGCAGHLGDASVFSLHKMLPASGGLLTSLTREPSVATGTGSPLHSFDLARIARVRQRNAAFLAERLASLAEHIQVLWPDTAPATWVPQTLPITVSSFDRDELYQTMNDRGFGVVSLYHTLIDEIDSRAFPDSQWLSRRILNLPVHQDITLTDLEEMVDVLGRVLCTSPCR